jgi:hypothetical protein
VLRVKCAPGSLPTAAPVACRAVAKTAKGFGLQKCRVVERPDDRLDVVGRNRAGLRLVTNQAANLMTRCDKG